MSTQRQLAWIGIGGAMLAVAVALGAAVGQHSHSRTSPRPEQILPSAPAPQTSSGGIALNPDEINAAGLQVAEVRSVRLNTNIDAFGRVEQPEAQLSVVPTRIAGRIEALHVQYTGQHVRRGQKVAELYSPDVASSLEEYRLARRNREAMQNADAEAREQADALVVASRRRLELWGLSSEQIEISTPSTELRIPVYAPAGGTVVERKVARGQYVNAGDTLFTLADLSTVWVKADVYESQLSQIRQGQTVKITS